jgi:hypothetical protein
MVRSNYRGIQSNRGESAETFRFDHAPLLDSVWGAVDESWRDASKRV